MFYPLTRYLWGQPRESSTDWLVRWLFLRSLGLIYLIAFVSFGLQITGLIGSNGILPAADFLQAVRDYYGPKSYWLVPTIFWLNASDRFLQMVPLAGALLSLLLMFGFARKALLILLFLAYLSLVSAGQDFMAFQWDILLLETGFLAIFLGSSSDIISWLFRWLLFRLMFLSGAVKLLSGDPTWRHLTALDFHFETQPLPAVIGWYVHQFPAWFHRISVIFMFVIELAIPFLFFLPRPRHLRFFAATSTLLLQMLIFLTGNYGFFNLLTMALCLFLFDDAGLHRVLPQRLSQRIAKTFAHRQESFLGRLSVITLAVVIVFISGFQLVGLFSGYLPQPIRVVLNGIAPFHLVNTYGLFAVMTTARPEIIIEGSRDGQIWLEYEFKYKPGDIRRPPVWVAPHQPRLDWQLWFAALGDYTSQPWFVNFMARLQQGSPQVLALLDKDPFPNAPPRHVRAWLYSYHFTDFATRNSQGTWWQRERIGLYFPRAPALSLNE
jgi:hypothetical protein